MIHKRLIGMGKTEKYIVGLYLCGAEGILLHQHQRAQTTSIPPRYFPGKAGTPPSPREPGRACSPASTGTTSIRDSSSLQLISYARGQQHRNGEIPGISGDRHRRPGAGRDRGQPGGEPRRLHHNPGRPNNVMYTTLPEGTGRLGQVICMEHVPPKTGWTVRTEIPGAGLPREIVNIMPLTAVVGPGASWCSSGCPGRFHGTSGADPGICRPPWPGWRRATWRWWCGRTGRRNRAAGRKLQPHGFQYQGPDREGLPDPAGQAKEAEFNALQSPD